MYIGYKMGMNEAEVENKYVQESKSVEFESED